MKRKEVKKTYTYSIVFSSEFTERQVKKIIGDTPYTYDMFSNVYIVSADDDKTFNSSYDTKYTNATRLFSYYVSRALLFVSDPKYSCRRRHVTFSDGRTIVLRRCSDIVVNKKNNAPKCTSRTNTRCRCYQPLTLLF